MSKNYNKYYNKPKQAEKTTEEVKETTQEVTESVEEVEEDSKDISESVDKEPDTKEPVRARVLTTLNFRSMPTKEDANVIAVLQKDEFINIDLDWNIVGGWSKVYVNGVEGYVMTEFISIEE